MAVPRALHRFFMHFVIPAAIMWPTGAVLAYALSFVLRPGERDVRGTDAVALAFGIMTMAIGVFSIVYPLVRPKLKMPRKNVLRGALAMTVSAATLMLPVLAPPSVDAWIWFGVFLVLFAVGVGLAWLNWRDSDELMRRITADSSVWSFWVSSSGLCIYATGERLGLFGGVSAWDIAVSAVVVNFIVSMGAALRRIPKPLEVEEPSGSPNP